MVKKFGILSTLRSLVKKLTFCGSQKIDKVTLVAHMTANKQSPGQEAEAEGEGERDPAASEERSVLLCEMCLHN